MLSSWRLRRCPAQSRNVLQNTPKLYSALFMPFPFYFHFGSFLLTKAHPLNPLELAQSAIEVSFKARLVTPTLWISADFEHPRKRQDDCFE
jgi:hypothetical protein